MTVSSYNTAIARSGPSAPLLYLEKKGLLSGSILDYGCGKGADHNYMRSIGLDSDSFDPHWNNKSLDKSEYDTILCTYVLNVVKESEENNVISSILSLLKDGGRAYITVRRDIKKDGETSRGFQRMVQLKSPVLKEYKGNYCIYVIDKN